MYVECQCPHADAYKSDQGAISHLVDEEYVEQVLASEPDIQNIVVSQMHATWTQVDLAITKGINRNNFAPLHIAVGGVHNFKFNEQHKKNTKHKGSKYSSAFDDDDNDEDGGDDCLHEVNVGGMALVWVLKCNEHVL